jgi:Uma2 family endonuclease
MVPKLNMAVAPSSLTLEQFLTLPEEKPALEFVDGAIIQKVSPKFRHSVLQGELVRRINDVAVPGRVALAVPELRVTFGGGSFVPDVSICRWNRLPADDEGNAVDDFIGAPDAAIEIASPQQSTNFLVRRCLWYVQNGVELAMLVDPADLSVLAFREGQAAVPWRGRDRIALGELAPDFELTVEELFGSLRLRD